VLEWFGPYLTDLDKIRFVVGKLGQRVNGGTIGDLHNEYRNHILGSKWGFDANPGEFSLCRNEPKTFSWRFVCWKFDDFVSSDWWGQADVIKTDNHAVHTRTLWLILVCPLPTRWRPELVFQTSRALSFRETYCRASLPYFQTVMFMYSFLVDEDRCKSLPLFAVSLKIKSDFSVWYKMTSWFGSPMPSRFHYEYNCHDGPMNRPMVIKSSARDCH